MDLDGVRVIHGPPGCGKTTWLLEKVREAVARYGPERVLVSSLTRTAAKEVRSREVPLPSRQVGTLHSFAYRALGLAPEQVARVERSPFRRWRGFGEYTRLRSALVPRRRWPPAVLLVGFLWELWKRTNHLLDFEDMIERAAAVTTAAPGCPEVLYIDEVQDLSPSDLRLALHWARSARGIVLVGDVDQSIYGFRGASPWVFSRVAPEHRRVLGQSWRVPRAVHRYAVRWISQLEGRQPVEYLPRDFEGEVRRHPGMFEWGNGVSMEAARVARGGRSVMCIAPCGHSLEVFARELRRLHVPFHNPYQPRNRTWNPLTGSEIVRAFVAPSRSQGSSRPPRSWTWRELWTWLGHVDSRKLVRPARKERVRESARERGGALVAASAGEAIAMVSAWFRPELGFDAGSGETLRRLLPDAFEDDLDYWLGLLARGRLEEPPRLVLGTIHSVKGAEADVVYVCPAISRRAEQAWEAGDRAETIRLFYVAFTRAREELVLTDSESERKVEWL